MGSIRVVTGPPCAGKSTHVSEAKGEGDLVVDFDLIARALGASGHRPGGAIKQAAHVAREAAIDVGLAGVDEDVWIIHTRPTPEQLARYAAAGAETVEIDPGLDECLARSANDDRPPGTDESIREWYSRRNEQKARPVRAFRMPEGGRMKIKTGAARVKAGPDAGLAEGEFIVYPSTFTKTPDSYGDIVAPGAFVDTIAEWKESGLTLPGLFGHRFDDPDFFVAGAVDMGEDEHGWWVKGAFDLESPKGPQVYRLAKSGRLNQLSFAFDVLDSAPVELEGGVKANELRKLKVYEFSFVPIGANQDTSIVAIKAIADGIKAGRVLSSANESTIRDAIASINDAADSLTTVLDAIDGGKGGKSDEVIVGTNDQSKASDTAEAKPGASDEEPFGAKSSAPREEPKSGRSPASVLAAISIHEKE